MGTTKVFNGYQVFVASDEVNIPSYPIISDGFASSSATVLLCRTLPLHEALFFEAVIKRLPSNEEGGKYIGLFRPFPVQTYRNYSS